MVNTPLLLHFQGFFSIKNKHGANLVQILFSDIICDFSKQLPINMFLLSKNPRKKPFVIFLYFCCFSFFSVSTRQKMCCGDQNHHQQVIYFNVSNFLMIYQPKNNNENLSLFGWYLAPVLPGLYHLFVHNQRFIQTILN